MPEYRPQDSKAKYRKPRKSSFPLPDVIDNADRLCVKVNIPNIPAHRQAFIGAVSALAHAYNWENDAAHTAVDVAQVWKQVFADMLDHFYDGCEGDNGEYPCVDFLPDHPIVKYTPNDPFRTPDYTPPGYARPPWYHDAPAPIPGVFPSDAMVNLLSLSEIPIVAFGDGFPHFSVTAIGRGKLELEFVKIPQAGYVLIQSDDAESVQLIELDSVSIVDAVSLGAILALFGLPGDYEVVQTEVVQLEFSEYGEHVTHCTFLPAIGGEVILGFGGGLRRVSLCGLSARQEDLDMYWRFRQSPDNPRIMQAQWELDGEWVTILDNTCCDHATTTTSRVTNNYELQISYDNGDTWLPDPDDPRATTPSFPPLPSNTPSLRCQAAWNMRKGFEDACGALAEVLNAALTIVALATVIAGVIAVIILRPTEAYKLIPVVIQLANAFQGMTAAEFSAALTNSVFDQLQCAIYCVLNDDGQITNLDAFASKIDAVFGDSVPRNAFRLIIYGVGVIGLNAMGSTDRGAIGYDCSECGCSCELFHDYQVNSHVYELRDHFGTWVNGNGWVNSEFSSYFNAYFVTLSVYVEGCDGLYARVKAFIENASARFFGIDTIERDPVTHTDAVYGGYNMQNTAGNRDEVLRVTASGGRELVGISVTIVTTHANMSWIKSLQVSETAL